MSSGARKPSRPGRIGNMIESFDLEIDADARIQELVREKITLPSVPRVPVSKRELTSLVKKLRKLTLEARDLVAQEEAARAGKRGYRIPVDPLKNRVRLIVQPKLPKQMTRATRRPLATIWGDGAAWIKGDQVERPRMKR